MIKAAVCDDEPYMLDHAALQLLRYMESRGIPHRLSRFQSGRELIESGLDFDLLLLDIQMDEPNGMAAARLLRTRGFDGLIIFMTVLREQVFDAFEVDAFDYLLKPIGEDRFLRTMDRAFATLERRRRKNVTIQCGNTFRVISLDEIIFCEVLGRKVYLHMRSGEIADYYGTLEELEQNVDSRFFRCHRSYLVNLDCVQGAKAGEIVLPDGGHIPVSRLREKELIQSLLSHMKSRRC